MLGIRNPALLGAVAGFSPLSLSPVLWLDASDVTTITASSGSVSQWNDKSGNGYNVTQGTGANQPTTGANTMNGLNVLTFATDDVLVGGTAPSLFASNTNPFEVFVVARFNTNADVNQEVGTLVSQNIAASVNSRQFHFARTNDASNVYSVGSLLRAGSPNGNFTFITRSPSRGREALFHVRWNGTAATLADGNTSASAGVGSINQEAGALFKVGARSNGTTTSNSFFLFGRIAEVIVYSKTLSSGERTLVYDYLAGKWGVTL